MSDSNPFVDIHPGGDPGPGDSAPDLGVSAGDGQPIEPAAVSEAPPRSYLELDDDVAQRYVRVKVDGQELEVPLAEALSGYSRTADYTRKTQELAAQRQQAEYALAVQRALQAHPQEALGLLARQYGVTFEQSPPPSREQPSPYGDDGYEENPYADPVERRLAQIERQNQALTQQWEQRQADERLRQATMGLQQRYQLSDADVREVVSTALQNRMGPESFDMIYKTLAFDRAQAARAQARAQQAAQSVQRQQAAATAQQLVGNGGSASMAGTSPAPTNAGPVSIAEAFEMASREHGVQW